MPKINNNHVQNDHNLIQGLLSYRWVFIAFLHLGLFTLAYIVAFLIRFEDVIPEPFYTTMLKSLPFFVVVQGIFFYYHYLYHGLWQYVSFPDAKIILRAILLSLVTLLIFDKFLAPYWGIIPRSIYILDGLLVASFVLGARSLVRQFRRPAKYQPLSKRRRILLVGPIEATEPLVREMKSRPDQYLPVALAEPTKNWHGSRLLNVPIMGGLEDLSVTVERYLVEEVLIAWPNAPQDLINDIVAECKRFQLGIKIVPSLFDLLEGHFRLANVRDIELEDLLPRPSVDIDREPIADFMADRVVLVTGAGGSIGSEICRQIAGYNLRRLILLERAENSLLDLEIALKQQFPELKSLAVVGSINDGPGLFSLFQEHKPDLVFHGAAYKHVPLMERYPIEAAYNNILGTRNLVRAALDTGTERFVLVSTDKAVNPTSIMGVSKRIAERYIYSLNGSQSTRFLITRFGNVLGSAGSVIHLFRNQILQGGPITITHPEIKRFFMTIPEAVQLVLQAAYMGKGGDIFVLNMGRSVTIRELAEKLCLLAGKTPGKDVDIIYTGLRPGEKMYEELFNADELPQPTEHPLILRALAPDEEASVWEGHLEEIATLVRSRDVEGLLAKFHEIVADYRCDQIPKPAELENV